MENPESYHDQEPETAVKTHSKAGREDCCGPLLAALHTTVLIRSGAHGCLADTDGRVLKLSSTPSTVIMPALCRHPSHTSFTLGRWPSHCVRASEKAFFRMTAGLLTRNQVMSRPTPMTVIDTRYRRFPTMAMPW